MKALIYCLLIAWCQHLQAQAFYAHLHPHYLETNISGFAMVNLNKDTEFCSYKYFKDSGEENLVIPQIQDDTPFVVEILSSNHLELKFLIKHKTQRHATPNNSVIYRTKIVGQGVLRLNQMKKQGGLEATANSAPFSSWFGILEYYYSELDASGYKNRSTRKDYSRVGRIWCL